MQRTPPKKGTGKPALSECSDEELLSRFVASHDKTALTALYERYKPLVWSACRGVLHHREDTASACQNTFLVLMRKADAIGDGQKLGNWLYGVARREALNVWRKRERRKSQETPLEETSQASQASQASQTVDIAALREKLAIVAAEVRRLPEKYRALLLLKYWQGKSQEEIAVERDLSVGTVACQLNRARELLRPRLTHYGFDLPE